MARIRSPCNQRETQVLRDAYETQGIAPHYVNELSQYGAKDVLMHLRPLPNASASSAESPGRTSSNAAPRAADPMTVATTASPLAVAAPPLAFAETAPLAKPSLNPSKTFADVHDKQSYVEKERKRVTGSSEAVEIQVERRWSSKKRRLLDGVLTMQIDERGESEDECLRNGWTLFIIDGDTRYYKEPTKEGVPLLAEAQAARAPMDESPSVAAGAAAIARVNESDSPVVDQKAGDNNGTETLVAPPVADEASVTAVAAEAKASASDGPAAHIDPQELNANYETGAAVE